MPELPEVQTVVTTIRPLLLGTRISKVMLARNDILDPCSADLPTLLTGRTFADVTRRGKRIVLTLDDGNRFYIHLGMTGRLSVVDSSAALLLHTHLIVDLVAPSSPDGPGRAGSPETPRGFAASSSVRKGTRSSLNREPALRATSTLQLRFTDPRRFGGIWWLGNADGSHGMGPEPLTLGTRQFAARLKRTTRAIKSALLDQTMVAGLGNIYVDESLFAAGIHPLTPANKLSSEQVPRLNRAIKSTLKKAINYRGSTVRDYRDANGEPGGFQTLHRVYDRKGQPCRKCKIPIERIVLGGRSTCFCPNCQSLR